MEGNRLNWIANFIWGIATPSRVFQCSPSVLRSKRAIQVNIEIMRAFVQLRRMLASHTDLARKLSALEKKYDAQFKIIFDAIRELMTPPKLGGIA